MKSKDLLNILDRVKGFRAGDVEKATNLIKNLCERDNSVSVTSYSKCNNEYFECPSCGIVKTIQFLSNSKKDFEIFCSDCGQRINVIRYKKNISVGDIVKIKTFEEDTEIINCSIKSGDSTIGINFDITPSRAFVNLKFPNDTNEIFKKVLKNGEIKQITYTYSVIKE